MKRPELRPTLWDGLLAVAVAAMAVLLALLLLRGGGGALTAVVRLDGEVLERVRLESGETERTYRANGYTLRVLFTPDGVQVLAADCPTRDCVRTGRISRSGQSIVCLPGRIIISLEGGGTDPEGPDIVIG